MKYMIKRNIKRYNKEIYYTKTNNYKSRYIFEIQFKKNTILYLLYKYNIIHPRNHKILDVGCGSGQLVKHLLKKHPSSCS